MVNRQSSSLAPITLFVYNRPWHTQQTIEALKKNDLASSSKLFIFSDGPRIDQDERLVRKVRDYIKTTQGFEEVIIQEREKNWGLADNIIDGVTSVVNKHGWVVVLEDDLVTSRYFLRFMNEALKFYKDQKRVWHISGWNYPINPEGLPDAFLWRVMNCWGWASWKDRWRHFRKNIDEILKGFSKERIEFFNFDGYNDAWEQVVLNKKAQINTWAVFWYAKIIEKGGLCLNPTLSFVDNIGLDGSGLHCGRSDGMYRNNVLNENPTLTLPMATSENQFVVDVIKEHIGRNTKHGGFLKRLHKLTRKIFK